MNTFFDWFPEFRFMALGPHGVFDTDNWLKYSIYSVFFLCKSSTDSCDVHIHWTDFFIFRNLVSASQDGKLIVWDGYTTNKVNMCTSLENFYISIFYSFIRVNDFFYQPGHQVVEICRNCFSMGSGFVLPVVGTFIFLSVTYLTMAGYDKKIILLFNM